MRNYKLIILLVFIATFFIISCASPLKKRLQSNEPIRFEGYITPVTIPLQIQYKPANAKFKITSVAVVQFGNEKENEEQSGSGYYQVSHLGGKTLWDIKITKFRTGNQTFSHKLPLAEMRLLVDDQGRTLGHEISLPAFEKAKIEKAKYQELKNKFDENIPNYWQWFPKTSIKSGDVIVTDSKENIKKILVNTFKLDANSNNMVGIEDIKCVLEGWAYYKDKKVLVFSVKEKQTIAYDELDSKINVSVEGYIILDEKTKHKIKSENKMVIAFIPSASLNVDSLVLNILSDFSAEIE